MKSWYMKNDMYDKEKIDMINNMKQDIYMKSWTISFDLNSIYRKRESLYHDR